MAKRNFDTKPAIVGKPANWTVRMGIFRALCRGGAVTFRTAPRIASLLKLEKDDGKLDTVTVNNHLRKLSNEGLIEAVGKENRAGRGRPSTVYALTTLGEVAATFRK